MKIIRLDNVDKINVSMIPLIEKTLNRVAHGHDEYGYAIISAMRDNLYMSDNNEIYSVFSDEDKLNSNDDEIEINSQIWIDENNRRTNELKIDLRDNGLSFIPVYGGFKEKNSNKAKVEKSFIVFPFNMQTKKYIDFNKFAELVLELGYNYQQDSVLIKYPDDNPVYYDCRTGKPDNYKFTNIKLNDVAQEYFTALKKWGDFSKKDISTFTKGKPQRFTFEGLYMNNFPNSINEHRRRSLEGELVIFKEYL